MPIIHHVKQGEPEWYSLRATIPTASNFDSIITPKTMKPSEKRHNYACQIIAGRLMNWQAESLDNIRHIAAGKENEPLAVGQLEAVFDIKTIPVGFVSTSDGRFGASPDRLVMSGNRIDTTVEVKAPTIPVQFRRLLLDDADDYRCQRQGQLWVAEADKAIFYSFVPGMPPYMVENGRDEKFITALASAMEEFSHYLEILTEKAKSLGGYEAFAALVTPAEAAYGANFRRAPLETAEALDAFLRDGKPDWGG